MPTTQGLPLAPGLTAPPLPQAFLCFALVFCALVQVAFWRCHNPTQVSTPARPHPAGEGPSGMRKWVPCFLSPAGHHCGDILCLGVRWGRRDQRAGPLLGWGQRIPREGGEAGRGLGHPLLTKAPLGPEDGTWGVGGRPPSWPKGLISGGQFQKMHWGLLS